MSGQIQDTSEFGRAIEKIASNPNYSTFCEVGTWNGLGSTVCLYNGIRTRQNAHLYTIEGNIQMYNQAKQHWNGVPNVTLLYGTLHRNIMTRYEVMKHPLFHKVDSHYNLHYESEYNSCLRAPLVQVPRCDVILLDGGEFSTQGDWNMLNHPGLKVVILDDTQIIKTSAIRNELLSNQEWNCIRDEPQDRNGWSIFVRSQESPDI